MHIMNETALAIDSELTFLEKEDVWGPKLLQVVTRAHIRASREALLLSPSRMEVTGRRMLSKLCHN